MARQGRGEGRGRERHGSNGSRITRQTIGPSRHRCHCLLWYHGNCSHYVVDFALCVVLDMRFPLPPPSSCLPLQQQLVAVVAHFPIELTIAVRLLTVTISGQSSSVWPGETAQLGKLIVSAVWPYLIKCIRNVRPSLFQ